MTRRKYVHTENKINPVKIPISLYLFVKISKNALISFYYKRYVSLEEKNIPCHIKLFDNLMITITQNVIFLFLIAKNHSVIYVTKVKIVIEAKI